MDDTDAIECQCGLNPLATKVVNGQEAEVNSIPWQVHLSISDGWANFHCGGTIIGTHTVLTAAHCVDEVDNPEQITISVGDHDITTMMETGQVFYSVDEVIVDPKYDKIQITNDFAILKTVEEIDFSQIASPACLPSYPFSVSYTDGKLMRASGWGWTENEELSDVLMKVNLIGVSNIECCNQVYGLSYCDNYLDQLVPDVVLCAGNHSFLSRKHKYFNHYFSRKCDSRGWNLLWRQWRTFNTL